jgi:hypothetical protein
MAFAALPTKYIVLLVDIDSVGIGREKTKKAKGRKSPCNYPLLACSPAAWTLKTWRTYVDEVRS